MGGASPPPRRDFASMDTAPRPQITRSPEETNELLSELASMFKLDIPLVRDVLEGEGGDANRCANRLQEICGQEEVH